MKKSLILILLFVSLSVFMNPVMATEKTPATTNTTEMPAEVRVMLDRLEEIKGMDRSELSSTERKELRREVRTIKKTMRASGNGLYISSGAIIIILLLIIIL
jgi:hypothetical protein